MPSTNGHGSKPERVALYLRVSSEEQREAGTIQTQRDYLGRYAAERGFDVIEVFADDGVSGTLHLHERPEGRRLLEAACEGTFQTVLVYKLDRLSRTQLGILDAADRLERLNVALRSATEHYETATPQGRLMFQMLGSFAEFERSTIQERTRDGFHREYRNGRFMGRAPFGYRANERGGLMVAPEDADLVREIFERIASGGTLYSEATRLNDLGVLPPSWRSPSAKRPPMKRWSPPTIRTIVRNTTYSGTHRITLSTGEVVEQTVPAIVDPNLQRRALAQLEENRRYSGGKKTRNYLLSGLITCEICGCSCSWRTNRTRGKTYLYYKCNGDHPLRAYRTAARHARNVSAPWLEETVWADVRRFLSAPGSVLERVRDQLASDGTQAEVEARHADITDRLAAAHKERDRWLHLYTQGHLEEHELEKHLADLRVRLNNLKVLVSSVKEELEVQHEHARVAKTAEAWLMSLRERVEDIEEDSPEAYKVRRQLVQLLVERIVVGRDEVGGTSVRITYRFGPPGPTGATNRFVTGVNNACPTYAHHTGIKSPTNSRTPTKE